MKEQSEKIIAQTTEWLEKAVIGLNLCPFAKAVHLKKQIRSVVSEAQTSEELRTDLISELKYLAASEPSEIDTTLLIHPDVLSDFYDYNHFLKTADQILHRLDLEGVIQIASFHPQYQFAETDENDITNFTNRSPYPILHLLREESVSRAIDSVADAESIPEKNIETLTKLGLEGWKKLKIPNPSES
jgi:hypothetical protein